MDTVRDYNPLTGEGTGFSFHKYDAMAFYTTVVRAVEVYRHPEICAVAGALYATGFFVAGVGARIRGTV